MILGVFELGADQAEIVVDNNNLMFKDGGSNTITTLEGLQLSKSGVLKEFPDLTDNPEWKKISLERLKEHVKTLEGENNKMNYIKDELTKFGWKPLFKHRAGFRPEKFK
jgi:hypothetical protein